MQCKKYIREAKHSICFNNLLIIVVISLLMFPAVIYADVKVTVGIVGFIPKAENTSSQNKITWVQARIMEMLRDPIYQPDIIFEPEYMLSHHFMYHSFPPERSQIPTENGAAYSIRISGSDGQYSLQSLGDPASAAFVNHINWLKAKAQEYQVSFFTNVEEQIDLAPYGKTGTADDSTGILIDKNGQINIVRKMIDFEATWEGCLLNGECTNYFECGPESEDWPECNQKSFHFWKDRLIGPTINSFQLTNKENKGYVILPILCGDMWMSFIPFEIGGHQPFWTDYHIQKLKENHAKKADIVIHPVMQADPTPWLFNIFEAIEDQSLDPEDFLEWNQVYENFIQKYIKENGLVRDDHSYYFGTNEPTHNFAGFELKPFLSGGPQPLGAGRYVVSDHYMIINVDIEEIAHKIDPDRVTANSREIAKMTFGVPSDAVSSKLYMYCPAGLSIGLGTNNNICNSWQTLALTAHSETQMEFRVTNTTQSVLKAVPNFYIYKASNPNYGYGVSGEITVIPDTQAPTISNGSPNGILPLNTTQATLFVTTDENATCKYDLRPGIVYASMTNTFTTTGSIGHSQTIVTGKGRSYKYYVKCRDTALNANTTDYQINFGITGIVLNITGSTYAIGDTLPIKWSAIGVSNVTIKLMDYKGNTVVRTIATVPAASGQYNWVVSNIDFNYDDIYTIQIADAANPTIKVKSSKINFVPNWAY